MVARQRSYFAVRLNPKEKIIGLSDATVSDFWAWAYSDILTTTTRGMFAEFLVGSALGVTENMPPAGWGDFDLLYEDRKIEVKASAYIQSWNQRNFSNIRFDIGERGTWDEANSTWLEELTRSADCYIFCLFAEKDRGAVNVIDATKWDFYVVSTHRINEAFKNQKTVGLRGIANSTEPAKIDQLRERTDLAMCEHSTPG